MAQTDARRLRFGVSLHRWKSLDELRDKAQRAEAAGIDVVTVADHLGAPAPFQVLAAAAASTDRIRLRTYVLDSYFWNPALLAREAATLDALSGGRLELGVGAGHMRHEHEDAGLPFPSVTERWAHTEGLLGDVRRRLADPDHRPRPVQQPVPLMVAAMGERGLTVAARTADVVGLAGLASVPGQPAGTFSIADSATTDARVALVRSVAADAGREPELDALLQRVVLDEDPERSAAAFAAEAAADGHDWFTTELLLDSPFVLFASDIQHAAVELARRSDLWGITSWSTHPPSAPALMEVARYSRNECSSAGNAPDRTSSA